MTQFESFLSDAFFERDGVISFTNGMLGSFSVLSTDDRLAAETENMETELVNAAARFEGDDENDTPETEPDAVTASAMTTVEEEEPDNEPAPVVVAGEIPMTDTKSYLYYEKSDGSVEIQYTYQRDKLEYYAETLRIMQSYLPDDGVICFTQVPLASMANRWVYQQNEYVGWGSSVETMLEQCLEGTERIYVFSTYDLLEPYVCGATPMFYHTDHHWSAEGAYIVLSEMLEKQGMPVIPYEEYEYLAILSDAEKEGYHDTFNVLAPLLPADSYVVTRRTDVTELPLMNYESTTYRSFMNNTRLPWRTIVSGSNNGRKALILCDSFGNAFAPYLLAYYDEVHMADFRHDSYDKSKVGGSIGEQIQYHGIDDVYIVTSTANGLRKDNSIVYLRKFLTE